MQKAQTILRRTFTRYPVLVAERAPLFGLLLALAAVATPALLNAVLIVQSLNLYHALAVGAAHTRGLAMHHAQWLFSLEQHLHVAVEPAVQRAVRAGLPTPWGTLPGAVLRQWVVRLYLSAVPAWLFAALVWHYLFRRRSFNLLRDVTIISALLSVACYQLFPVAPPRFLLEGAPYHLQDWAYEHTPMDVQIDHVVGFNPFAAFPSVHVLWALLPALCLLTGCRRRWVWPVALLFPLLMVVTVLATGNHYVLDCVGSLAVLAVSYGLAYVIARGRRWLARWHPYSAWSLYRRERDLPAALCLCLLCAGLLSAASASGGVRALLGLNILILIVIVTRRNPASWIGKTRRVDERRQLLHHDYLSGVLFVAGATDALHSPGMSAGLSTRIGACLWLLACLSAVLGHTARKARNRELPPRDGDVEVQTGMQARHAA